MKNKKSASAPGEIQDGAVVEYLRKHPDFFERYPDLLLDLEVPHPSGVAISLVERQQKLLRAEVARYRKQLGEFIAVAKENEQVNQRLHRLTLALVEAGTLEEALTIIQDGLHDDFLADAVELRLFSQEELDDRLARSTGEGAASTLQELFERGRPLCGRLQRQQMKHIFGSQAEEIRSAAVIPLQTKGVSGLLAIGSHNEDRFHPAKGTEFLTRLGDLVSRKLQALAVPGA